MIKCNGCGQEIKWIQMKSGKMMPVDLKKLTIISVDQSNGEGSLVYGFESHFSTCPKADEFRKGKKQ